MGEIIERPLAFGSSDAAFLPGASAWEVLNLQVSDDGVLIPVTGLLPYSTVSHTFGNFHGIYHGVLDNNTRDVLLARHGVDLEVFDGWSASWTTLKTGLSDDANAKYPDVFVEVAGKVVWSNGIDNPMVYDGYTLIPLGYNLPPSAPMGIGPEDTGDPIYRNEGGYAHPGRIGTVGDTLSGQDGSVLAGSWRYYVQFENLNGDLSPLSPASGAVNIRTERTAVIADEVQVTSWRLDKAFANKLKWHSVVLDDLTKQFVVDGIAIGPEGTVARHIYRTPDMRSNAPVPQWLCRIPDNTTRMWPDSAADAELQWPAKEPVSIPMFKVATQHQGRLVIGNTSADPGIVMASEPSMPGTFLKHAWAYIGDGEEVTGLMSFDGILLAFTQTKTYRVTITESSGVVAEVLSSTIGCVAPASLCVAGWGALLWLGRDGVYQLQQGQFSRVSDAKFRTVRRGLLSQATRASAIWDQGAREWCLFFPEGGATELSNVLTFDGQNFRSRDYGVAFRAVTSTRCYRNLLLGGGARRDNHSKNLYVLNRGAAAYHPPTRKYRYVSQWVSSDVTRRRRFTMSTLYLGFLERSSSPLVVSVWGNGRRSSPQWQKTLTPLPTDWAGELSSTVIGTTKVQEPRIFWLKVDVNLRSVDAMSFGIETTDGGGFALAAWAADVAVIDSGARTPR